MVERLGMNGMAPGEPTGPMSALDQLVARVQLRLHVLAAIAKNGVKREARAGQIVQRQSEQLAKDLARVREMVGTPIEPAKKPWWKRLLGV